MNKIFLIKYLLAGNSTRSARVLYRLAKHNSTKIRRRVAENFACPTDLLSFLSRDKQPEVRIAVALNKKSNFETCKLLSEDFDPDVRFMMASASYTVQSVLEKLSKDENPYVSARAQRTLALKRGKIVEGFGVVKPAAI